MSKKTKFYILISLMVIYILTICYLNYNIKSHINVINEKYNNMSMDDKNIEVDSNKSYGYVDTLTSIYNENGLEIVSINNNEKGDLLDIECDFKGKLPVLINILKNIEKSECFNNIKFINIRKENIDIVSAKVKLQFFK